MGDIRRNISRSEMACQCGCGFDTCDTELMDVLQAVVDHFQEKIGREGRVILSITGPNRCYLHNEEVQREYFAKAGKVYEAGSSRSQHVLGKAADYKLFIRWYGSGTRTQISPKEIDDVMKEKWSDKYGFGLYSNRNHADVRAVKARWDVTNNT